MFVMILMMMLFFSVVKTGIRLAWGTTKFLLIRNCTSYFVTVP